MKTFAIKSEKKACLLITLIMLVIATSHLYTDEQNKVNNAFKKLMLSAHPLPDKNANKKQAPYLLAEYSGIPLFLNANMIDTETEEYRMQNESSIAVNPMNPRQLIGSAVDYRAESSTWVYFSEDAGKTWVNYNLGKHDSTWRCSNDPSVAYDADGYAYLVYGGFGIIDDTSHGENFGENGVFISISTDGGKTWDSTNRHIPVIIHKGQMTMDSLFEDKYYISVDNSSSSPYHNQLYIPWKRVTPRDSATQIVISKSTDKGRSWSMPLEVSPRKTGTSQDTTYGQSFPLVATGPNGEVYLVWNDGIVHGVGFAKSSDGGQSFSEPRLIQNYSIFGLTRDLATNNDPEPIWRHALKEVVRAEAYPVIVVDTNSSRKGTIYLTWAADSVPNIYFSKSTDEGESWSTPKIIHSETKNDQFWQWMAVDPMNGDLAVMYLDSRDDENNLMVESYVSFSTDAGETWTDRKVSDFNSDIRRNPFSNHFAGDYSGMAFYYGKIYPSWVDMRNALKNIFDSDVYTSLINVQAPAPVENFKAITIPEEPNKLKITWEAPTQRAFGQELSQEDFHFVILSSSKDSSIELISTQTEFMDEGLTQYQKYYYEISVVSGTDTSIVRYDSAYAGGAKELDIAEILSATGNTNNEISLKIQLPQYRADKTTQLINLSYIGLFNSKDQLLQEFQVSPTDAGKTLDFAYIPEEPGYYNLYVKAYDSSVPSNESAKSNEVELFFGAIGNDYSDNFDSGFRKYRFTETWNTSTDFYKTAPASLTDSPDGNYKKMMENHIDIFPIKQNKDEETVLEFWHAALITKRDTAKIEVSDDNGLTWKRIAGFNQLDYSFWADGTRNQEDWKYEKIIIPSEKEDTVIFRFSLVTKLGASDDGWYIDDLNIYNQPIGVEDNIKNNSVVIFPNPTSNILNFHFDNISNIDISNIKIYSIYGNKIQLNVKSISENNIQFDV
ncbi:MAG: exo-alpha-sialidase, partial [bacterium]